MNSLPYSPWNSICVRGRVKHQRRPLAVTHNLLADGFLRTLTISPQPPIRHSYDRAKSCTRPPHIWRRFQSSTRCLHFLGHPSHPQRYASDGIKIIEKNFRSLSLFLQPVLPAFLSLFLRSRLHLDPFRADRAHCRVCRVSHLMGPRPHPTPLACSHQAISSLSWMTVTVGSSKTFLVLRISCRSQGFHIRKPLIQCWSPFMNPICRPSHHYPFSKLSRNQWYFLTPHGQLLQYNQSVPSYTTLHLQMVHVHTERRSLSCCQSVSNCGNLLYKSNDRTWTVMWTRSPKHFDVKKYVKGPSAGAPHSHAVYENFSHVARDWLWRPYAGL